MTNPSFPANARDARRRLCSSRITSTIFAAYEGATEHRLFKMIRSSSSGMSPTWSSTNRLRNALERVLRPP